MSSGMEIGVSHSGQGALFILRIIIGTIQYRKRPYEAIQK